MTPTRARPTDHDEPPTGPQRRTREQRRIAPTATLGHVRDTSPHAEPPLPNRRRRTGVYTALNALREALLEIATGDPEWVGSIAGQIDEAEGNIERLRQAAAVLVVIADQVVPF
jgi:hypothetical protein